MGKQSSMLEALHSQLNQYDAQIQKVETLEELEQLRIQLLGKQGVFTLKLREIGQLLPEERPQAGRLIHQIKQRVQNTLEKRQCALTQKALLKSLHTTSIDVSLPGRGKPLGGIHPITQIRTRLERLFTQVGFEVKTGPEIEEDSLNFTALNIPENHPARALHDTFYIKDQSNLLLRTHTSTVQIHSLRERAPPLQIISTGAVYRCDSDMTHTPMFHQLEGMVVNETANFTELKGLLIYFLKTFFEDARLVTRFRASYFPFTEPSAEVDILCVLCAGQKCRFCSHSGWLEILGCGMIHPNVLRDAGVDSEHYQGYAFGIGIERLALLRYRIPDIRLLFENDSRLLSQFT
jgi:phenylalanyl-tRNA synthetase alpha chain